MKFREMKEGRKKVDRRGEGEGVLGTCIAFTLTGLVKCVLQWRGPELRRFVARKSEIQLGEGGEGRRSVAGRVGQGGNLRSARNPIFICR
jgi:hypothetical protein